MTKTVQHRKASREAHEVASVAMDYFEGWFDGDEGRMRRALHPALAKRSLEGDGFSLNETTAEWMFGATAEGLGTRPDPAERALDVEVAEIYGDIASVIVRSVPYREYIHLVRTRDGWKIVNALWQRT